MQSSSESCSASANCPQRSTEVAVENAHASPPHCFARNPRWRAVDKSCVKFALMTEVTKNKNGKLWWMNSHCRHQTTPTNIPRDRQFPSNIVHHVRPTRRSRHCHTRSLRLRSSRLAPAWRSPRKIFTLKALACLRAPQFCTLLAWCLYSCA